MAKPLTDRTLKALEKRPAEAGKTYTVPDGLVPGLAVRVMPSGARTFVLVTRFPGKSATRRALGSYGELTLEQAREKARGWLALIKRGIDPADDEDRQRAAEQQRQANSFAAVCEDYFRLALPKQRKGAEVEQDMRREFISRWGKRPITDITARDVVAVLDAKQDTPYQAHNLLGHIRRLYNWSIGRSVYGLDRSPCDRMKPADVIGKKLSRTRVLTDAEIRLLWAATETMGYPYGPMFRMLLLTGQRLREVSDARWSEFDLDRKLWIIPSERMKMGGPHTVPLADDVVALLKELPRFTRGDYLYSAKYGAKPVNGASVAKRRLDGLMEECPPFVLHDLRRTMRTGLSGLPISTDVAELVIAHARPGLRRVYDMHSFEAEKRRALDLWAARVRDIVTPPPENVVSIAARQQ
jgi:integrase